MSSKECSINGCNNKSVGRGWCHKHYKRWQLNGDPEKVKRISGPMPLNERFEMQYIPVTESGCWIWVGSISKSGYGRIKVNKKTSAAHRVSYELHKEEIREGMYICHTCDNPSCVNPNHLYQGTAKQNTLDMLIRNRAANRRNENHPNVKYSNELVMHIRNSNKTLKELEKETGIGEKYLWQLINKKKERRILD